MAKTTLQKNCLKLTICCLIALIALLLMGCGHGKPWKTSTKVLYTGLIAGQVLDYTTTQDILDDGGHECNPIFDGHNSRIIPFKLAVLIGSYYLVDLMEPEYRKWFLIPANIITWGVVAHNYGERE